MDIKIHEIKKIIASPVIIGLMIVFTLFNIITITQNSYMKEDLKSINNIISEFGYEIDDEMIKDMYTKFQNSLDEINKITKVKFNKTYKSMDEFFSSYEYSSNNYKGGAFTKDELELINEINLLGIYSILSSELVESYENLDMIEIGNSLIEAYGLSGKAEDVARENYKKLADRFEEIKENKEHKNLFYLGQSYRMHSTLFRDLFTQCIYEIMIIVVLITAYLVNYEFDNKTNLLVYSTKRGRKNVGDKFVVCVGASLIVSTMILGISLLAFFTNFDYSNLLNVSINNVFNWEFKLPYISWYNNTFIEHLLLSVLLVLICSMIFAIISFIISILVKNSYIVFFIFFILFGVSLIVPSVISKSSPFILYSHYTVFNLILNPHMFFMDKGPMMLKDYEIITIVSNFIVLVLGSTWAIKRFSREDLN